MNVTLNPEFEDLVQQKLRRGEYNSADEIVHVAMSLFKQWEEDRGVVQRVNAGAQLPVDGLFEARLKMLLDESAQSGEPCEMNNEDWEDIQREGLALVESRKAAR